MNSNLQEGRRAPGSEWLKNHPRLLEAAYAFTKRAFVAAYPLAKRVAPEAAERAVIAGEELTKGYAFNCQMCGQCVLHSTGMTCPMTCPKNLRNGPCGGVRADGHCEVIPQQKCIWVQAWERSRHMPIHGDEIHTIQPPVDRQLHNTSSWINMVEKRDVQLPKGWQ